MLACKRVVTHSQIAFGSTAVDSRLEIPFSIYRACRVVVVAPLEPRTEPQVETTHLQQRMLTTSLHKQSSLQQRNHAMKAICRGFKNNMFVWHVQSLVKTSLKHHVEKDSGETNQTTLAVETVLDSMKIRNFFCWILNLITFTLTLPLFRLHEFQASTCIYPMRVESTSGYA